MPTIPVQGIGSPTKIPITIRKMGIPTRRNTGTATNRVLYEDIKEYAVGKAGQDKKNDKVLAFFGLTEENMDLFIDITIWVKRDFRLPGKEKYCFASILSLEELQEQLELHDVPIQAIK